MAAFTVIGHTELTGNATSIEFTSISGSYDHLCLEASLRVDSSEYWQYGKLQLGNGSADTGSNYSMTSLYASSGTPTSGRASGDTWIDTWSIVGASALADTFGSTTMWIPNYANTANFKQVLISNVNPNNVTTTNQWMLGVFAGLWSSTSAVDVVKISPWANNLVQYSTVTLYGVTGA
jgi:hypothetical protein